MMTIETPQSFVTHQECDKIAFQNGFRRTHAEVDGWRQYESTTAQGSIWLAYEDTGSWVLSMDHAGVMAEIGLEQAEVDGPGIARFRFLSLTALYAAMPRLYELAVSLPDAPLQEFLHRTKGMPKTTEAERLVVQRVGQNIFRDRLIDYWKGQCPVTGVTDRALLRASHIKPWKDCESDEERLDVYNGLLLSALWDAAFDQGLLSFSDSGEPVFSTKLSEKAKSLFEVQSGVKLILRSEHLEKMSWHKTYVFQE